MALSDYEFQPIKMLIKIIKKHNPDAILYAGDYINRFIKLENLILFRPPYAFQFSYNELEKLFDKLNLDLFTHNSWEFNKIKQDKSFYNLLHKRNIPFYYVNGNKDYILNIKGKQYVYIHKGDFYFHNNNYLITTSSEGKLKIEKRNDYSHFLYPFNESIIEVQNGGFGGIYAQINPNYGKFTIQNDSEKITIFGCECDFTSETKIKNVPKEYADIYLSHIPPLGTLDLSGHFEMSGEFSTAHIGSKKFLSSIKKYRPKYVFCGHSHIWGGISTKIGNTEIINVSSPKDDPSHGSYALLETNDWSVKIETIEQKDIRIIRGIKTVRNKVKKKQFELEMKNNFKDVNKYLEKSLENLSQTRRIRKSHKEILSILINLEKY